MSVGIDAIERWALGRGILSGSASRLTKPWMVATSTLGGGGWSHGGVVVWYFGDHGQCDPNAWYLDMINALLWANTVESGVVVDAGPCSLCNGIPPQYGTGAGAKCRCDRCNFSPSHRESTSLARMVCDADLREDLDVVHELMLPSTRDALAVESDKLIDDGAPLGEWIAAWLRGVCRTCDGHPSICDHASGSIEGYGCSDCMNTGHTGADPCPDCAGHGVILGAHVDAMVAGLEPK